MDEAKLRITNFLLEEKKNFQHLPIRTLHLPQKYVITKYDLHEISFSITVDTIIGRDKYGTTELKPGPLYVAYQYKQIILIYILMKQECGQPMT